MTVNAPRWDEWDWSDVIARAHVGTVTPDLLWTAHAEHRMFFPKLIAIVLDRFGGWNQQRECLVSVAIMVAVLPVLSWLLRRAFSDAIAYALLLISALLLFSPDQSENWTWGFQTAWFLIDALAIVAAALAARRPLRRRDLVLLGVVAIVASYSSALGLCVLASVLVALVVRADVARRTTIAWSGFSLAVTCGYLVLGTPIAHTGAALATEPFIETLGNAIAYAVSWLGSPFGHASGVPASMTVGTVGLTGAVLAIALLWRAGLAREPIWAGFISLVAYALTADALTAAGRTGLGVGQALASRYITTADLFWIGTAALVAKAWSTLPAGSSVRRWSPIVGASIVALLGVGYVDDFAMGASDLATAHVRDLTNLASLYDFERAPDAAYAAIFPLPHVARGDMALLASVGDGPVIARPARSADRGYGSFDGGVVDRAFASGSAARGTFVLHGWAIDPVYRDVARRIDVLVDGRRASATITFGLPEPHLAAELHVAGAAIAGFQALIPYAHLRRGPHVVSIYVESRLGPGYYRITPVEVDVR